MKQVIYSRAALKTLGKIDQTTASRIIAKVELLAEKPEALANNVSALKGGNGTMRLRVGNWRIIYSEDGFILSISRIAPRSSAYD